MLQIVWEYRVHREKAAEFERYYGSEGDWVKFFRQGAGYQGTTLLRDQEHVDHYATIDRWDSIDSFRRFKEKFAAGYKERDAHCNQFTIDEKLVGYFEAL
ncbi:MAG TPA: antibiotic biosynthesis monooxygenase [Terriglobales bacterium]|nr:antibiotic biosynthesis monooxygenase [Terriglobales bacterium]